MDIVCALGNHEINLTQEVVLAILNFKLVTIRMELGEIDANIVND